MRAAITVLLLTTLAPAQTPPSAFDVASVKVAPSDQRTGADFRILPGGRLEITDLRLRDILQQAFGIRYYQLSGGPAWMETDRFNIYAKAEGNPTRDQMLRMVQALLADRFQLKAHRETKEGNVYYLSVARTGHKLGPPSGERAYVSLMRLTPPELPGVNYALDTKRASMTLFAQQLFDALRRPVIDRTALEGEFSFHVEYAIDDNPESGPPLTVALPAQLGLKLDAGKGPVETLVIDSVQKPSGN